MYEEALYLAKLKCEVNEDGMTETSVQKYNDYMSTRVNKSELCYTANELLNTIIAADKDTVETSIMSINKVYGGIEVKDYVKFIRLIRKLRGGGILTEPELTELDSFNFKDPYVQLAVVGIKLRYAVITDGNNVSRLKLYISQMNDINAQIAQVDESKMGRGFHVDSY